MATQSDLPGLVQDLDRVQRARNIRRAATVMRERADACFSRGQEWYSADELHLNFTSNDPASSGLRTDSEFIASWPPVMCLYIADWLDFEFASWERAEKSGVAAAGRAIHGRPNFPDMFASSLAAAYLKANP